MTALELLAGRLLRVGSTYSRAEIAEFEHPEGSLLAMAFC